MNTYQKYKKRANDFANLYKEEISKNNKFKDLATDYYLLEKKYKELKELLHRCKTLDDFEKLQKRWN